MRASIRGAATALAVAASVPLFAQTQATGNGGLTMDAAVAIALTGNKTIVAARLRHPVDLAGVDVAKERPNPELTYEGTRETPRQAIGMQFPIELGGKRGARTTAAQAAVATGDAETNQVIAGVLDDVRRTYITLATAERRVAIEEEVAGLFTRARDAAHARFEAGDAPRRDDVAAQADWLTGQNALISARGEADAVRAELNTLLGRPPGTPITLAALPDPGALPELQAAMTRADEANVDLQVINRQIDEQNARIGVAKSLKSSDLTLGGGISFQAQPEFGVGWRANGGITVPLFTTHTAGVVLATAELTRLQAEREATRAAIGGAIAAALARATSAASAFTSYERDILPLTQQDEAFAQDAYQSGQTGIDGLIVALQRARERRLAGLQSLLDLHLALADLERAIKGPLR
jgi:cobalt-zinc-cadmium efflux system outer membrane protein